MGFIVRAAKMSPFSPLHLAFEASRSRAQVGMLWAAAQEKPHALAQGHGGLGGAHKVGMEGGVSRWFQPKVTAIYIIQYLHFSPLKQNQNTSKSQAFLVGNNRDHTF